MSSAKKILVVEDNPTMRKLVRLALECEGLEVVEAEDGRTALDLAGREQPDLILQDLILPDLDGLELLALLRALPWPAKVPILALSGFVTRLDEARLGNAGFDDMLLKPVAPSRLLEVVRAHLAVTRGPESRPGAGHKILLVDDDPVQRKLAAIQLGNLGFEVVTASDGAEAVEKARAEIPDAVVSDVLMPRLDGFELCLELRRDRHLQKVPIVLFSANFVDEADRQLGRDVGASAYLCRGDGNEDVGQVVLAHLRDAPPPLGENDALLRQHEDRTARQLDRQVVANAALVRQLRMQRASIEVLGGIADALAAASDPASALRDSFIRCVDASGLARGLLVLRDGDEGRCWVAARCGYASDLDAAICAGLEAPELLARLGRSEALALRPETPGAALLEVLGTSAAILAPVVGGGRRLGKLLIAGDLSAEAEAQVTWFTHQVAIHLGQALALAGAFRAVRDSQDRYHAVVTQASDAISLVSLDGFIREANDRMGALVGVGGDELVGRHFAEFATTEDRETELARFAELVRSGQGIVEGVQLVQPDGTVRLADLATAVVHAGPEPMMLVIGRDVTERNRQAQELRESEERFRQLAEGVSEAFFVIDAEGSERLLRYISPQIEVIFQRPARSLYDAPAVWTSLVHPDDTATITAWLERPTADPLRIRILRPTGACRDVELRCTLLRHDDGSLRRIVGVIEDITERVEAMQALEARARLASFTADASMAFSGTPDLRAALQRTAELAVADLDAVFARIWLAEQDGEDVALRLAASAGRYTQLDASHARIPPGAFKIGRIAESRKPHLRNDLRGDPHVDQTWAAGQGLTSFAAYPLLVGDRLVGVFGMFGRRPFDERTLEALSGVARVTALAIEGDRSRDEARAADTRFRELIESAPDLMHIVDAAGRVIYANRAWRETLGLGGQVGTLALGDAVSARCREQCGEVLRKLLAGMPSVSFEGALVAADGHEVLVEGTMNHVSDGGAFRAIGILRDITGRRRMEQALEAREAQVVEMQKLEAIGQLAGGVAHDFNNLMGIVLACGEFVLAELPEGHPAREDVIEIRRAGERAAALTRQLLAYARRQILEPRIVDANETLAEMTRMLKRTVGDDIELTVAADPETRRVKVDPGQLEQVILNLVVNARDAMPDGGALTLATRRVEGGWTAIDVHDTGTGIDEATQQRLFEPFFTTKPPGKGTGLGLAVSFGIVRQSGGTIQLTSTVGVGSTFTVLLPETTDARGTGLPRLEARVAGGSETILLLEDQPILRRTITRTLRGLGYAVIEAGTADEARATAVRHGGAIDLVLSDVVTPGGGAAQAVAEIASAHPGCASLFMSGYADATMLTELRLPAGVPFIHKPFAPEALARKVREVLDAIHTGFAA